MMMMLIALTLGVSVLAVAKVVLSSLLSFSLYKISRLWRFCTGQRQRYQHEAYRKRLGLKGSYSF